MTTRSIVLAAALAALGAASAGHATEKIALASLGEVSGKVLINQGKGFVAARPGMELRAGDRVIALDGAAAQVVYKDGCVTRLKERNLLPVDAKGCATPAVNPQAEVAKLAQGPAGARTDVPANAPGATPVGAFAGVPAWVVPAGLFVGGALLVRNDSNPISAR